MGPRKHILFEYPCEMPFDLAMCRPNIDITVEPLITHTPVDGPGYAL